MKRLRILLTGARAPATLELGRLGARAGYTVHVADTHRWNICRGSRLITGQHVLPPPRHNHHAYVQAVNRLVRQFGIDVVVPTCEEVFHLAAVRDQIDACVACESHSRLTPFEPDAGLSFRSRLALTMYGERTTVGDGLLDAADDPWPRRRQAVSWAHLLLRSVATLTEPRALSTRDIEWNGE